MKLGDVVSTVTFCGGPEDGVIIRLQWKNLHRLVTHEGSLYRLREEFYNIEETEDLMADVGVNYFYDYLGVPKPIGPEAPDNKPNL